MPQSTKIISVPLCTGSARRCLQSIKVAGSLVLANTETSSADRTTTLQFLEALDSMEIESLLPGMACVMSISVQDQGFVITVTSRPKVPLTSLGTLRKSSRRKPVQLHLQALEEEPPSSR